MYETSGNDLPTLGRSILCADWVTIDSVIIGACTKTHAAFEQDQKSFESSEIGIDLITEQTSDFKHSSADLGPYFYAISN